MPASPGRLLRLVRGRGASVEPAEEPADELAPVARAAVAGDRAAIRTFLVTVGPHLLRVVRRVLGSSHPDVDDVAQESAFAVMEALPRHRGESSLLHFACRVAVLTAMNARRRQGAQKRKSERDQQAEVEAFADPGPAPDAALSARATAALVRELLDTLPLEQAEVLALHCVLGHTVPEIAASTGTRLETVRSRLRLAKQALRERVQHDPRLCVLLEVYS
jgi:RNA polymerase sigma-70 factor (ECF subfamily)